MSQSTQKIIPERAIDPQMSATFLAKLEQFLRQGNRIAQEDLPGVPAMVVRALSPRTLPASAPAPHATDADLRHLSTLSPVSRAFVRRWKQRGRTVLRLQDGTDDLQGVQASPPADGWPPAPPLATQLALGPAPFEPVGLPGNMYPVEPQPRAAGAPSGPAASPAQSGVQAVPLQAGIAAGPSAPSGGMYPQLPIDDPFGPENMDLNSQFAPGEARRTLANVGFLSHYLGRTGEPLSLDFSDVDTSMVQPSAFTKVQRLLQDGKPGTYAIDSRRDGKDARLAFATDWPEAGYLGRTTLRLDGELTIDPSRRWGFKGRLSSQPDVYKFNPVPWGERTIKGEVSTRIGSILPGKIFGVKINGAKDIEEQGALK
jgi:hypothetical protein